MNGEDYKDRPDIINSIINGLERYNPEAVPALEEYLGQQCEERFVDCNANRTLLKLYQLNPDRIKDEVITNTLVKTITQFPGTQFTLALHLINPTAAVQGELGEAVQKLRSLNSLLEGCEYARFWATLDSDDLYADLVADISGFEDLVRQRIALLTAQACREVSLANMEAWLGLDGEAATKKFITETSRWTIDESRKVAIVPKNPENEAKKTEIREDVSVDMFSRVIKRAWEVSA
ncbi:eukaryotic translation initiation factor 3 subunit K [Zalerion maritima]|uniref:Eukaryotic translation initiation factor 3 subunit K n=1 Tax=Zalerion maritima TaxID=339359 RepID=A0AAD5WRR6_9PEZI|nr:eukaryotic translation initiation factor 3 subunit K [Zalerion maritima]